MDDPINPRHYGGTACADIGERLSANSYQILKYCWRLGKKDAAKVELGKALWYLNRELELFVRGVMHRPATIPPDDFFADRLVGVDSFVNEVAWALIRYNRIGFASRLLELRQLLQDRERAFVN